MQRGLEVFATGEFFKRPPVFRPSLLRRVVRRRLINLGAHGIQIQLAVARANVFALLDLNQIAVFSFRRHSLLLYNPLLTTLSS